MPHFDFQNFWPSHTLPLGHLWFHCTSLRLRPCEINGQILEIVRPLHTHHPGSVRWVLILKAPNAHLKKKKKMKNELMYFWVVNAPSMPLQRRRRLRGTSISKIWHQCRKLPQLRAKSRAPYARPLACPIFIATGNDANTHISYTTLKKWTRPRYISYKRFSSSQIMPFDELSLQEKPPSKAYFERLFASPTTKIIMDSGLCLIVTEPVNRHMNTQTHQKVPYSTPNLV